MPSTNKEHPGILRELLSMQPVSGEALSQRLGITRAAVWKHIKALEQRGYRIEAVRGQGYQLRELSNQLSINLIEHFLTTRSLGRNCTLLDETTSTNAVARQLAEEGVPHGTLVLTNEQTTGKGRKGRSWVMLPGGVAMSLVLRPKLSPVQAPRNTIPVALAVRDAVSALCGIDAGVKWPNDLLIDGKKFCGISLQMSADAERVDYIVSGIGINLAGRLPAEISTIATTLEENTAMPLPNRNELIATVLNHLEEYLDVWESDGFEPVMQRYKRHSVTLHQHVRVIGEDGTLEGYVEDFGTDGGIQLRTDDGVVHVLSGDVTIRKV